VAVLDGGGPRPLSLPADDPPPCVPTYDVMAAASAVWKPGSDVIAFAILSVSTPAAGAVPLAAVFCCW
jgi:hypothetical protein